MVIHLLLWLLFFTSIQVNWKQDWFDPSLRTNTPAPLSVIIFPLVFYLNAFYLIPRYFKVKKVWLYLLLVGIIFGTFELIRIAFYTQLTFDPKLMLTHIGSRDSFLFGDPSPVWFGMLLSTAYRVVRDRMVNQRRIAQLEMMELKTELQQLRSQVDPHFLFNNLNTLDALIEDNNVIAKKYLSNLSSMYRYYLSSGNMELIDLNKEWEALLQYMSLLNVRFQDAYRFEINFGSVDLSRYVIPPGLLQGFVENIVKHNTGDEDDPLIAKIDIDEVSIIITNPIKPKITKAISNNVGIANAKQRMKLLTDREIEIEEKENFLVRIPMVKKIE